MPIGSPLTLRPCVATSPSRRSFDAGRGGTARVLLGLGVSPGGKACRAMMDKFAQVGWHAYARLAVVGMPWVAGKVDGCNRFTAGCPA